MRLGFFTLLFVAGSLVGETSPPNYSYSPWIPISLELQPSLKGEWQNSGLATAKASIGTAFDPFAAEVGIEAFHSKKMSFSFEDVFLLGRYLWLDQDKGDRVSLAVGAQLSLVSSMAVKQRDLFHFGSFEAELFASLGSEQYCSEFATDWDSRWWLTVGSGIANKGSPWFFGNAAYEYVFCPNARARLFTDAVIGQGHKQKALDLGVAGTYESFDCGCIDLSYAYRVYGKYVRRHVSCYTLSLYYPFGL